MIKKDSVEETQPLLFSPEKSCRWTMHSIAGGRTSEQLTIITRGNRGWRNAVLALRDPRCNYQSREPDVH